MRLRLDALPLITLGLGLLVLVADSAKAGLFVAGLAGLAAGALRWTQPPASISWLVSRRTPVDVAASLILGAALCVVALSLPH